MTDKNEKEIQRTFYSDGQLKTEVTWADGLPNGASRRWHSNGALAYEAQVKNGVEDGLVRHWNSRGELLGSYEIINGTGLVILWHENGGLFSEIQLVDGEFHGRQRVWWESGELGATAYWIRGRQVSKKKYHEAAERDPTLLRYDEREGRGPPQEPSPRTRPGKKRASSTIRSLSVSHPGEEAKAWLESAPQAITRTLGSIETARESLELVKGLYRLGAERVCAIDITAHDNAENTGRLVIRLPKSEEAREKLFEWAAGWAKEVGYEAEEDAGQTELFVSLD
jgi:antitoxin component YwqK of YwqJK toxin-antitoxin module